MMDVLATTAVGVIKALAYVCDAVTFLPYYLLSSRRRSQVTNRIKAKPVSDKPGAPYRSIECIDSLSTVLFDGCDTVDDLFNRSVKLYPDKNCLGTRICLQESEEVQANGKIFKKAIYGEYEWQTYLEANRRAVNFGSGLSAIGAARGEYFVIFAESCADWMVAAQAGFKYNFPFVTLYSTLGDDALVHMINETEVKRVLTTPELLPKFKKLIDKMPSITHLIYMDQYRKYTHLTFPDHVAVMSMTRLETIGSTPENLNKPVVKATPDDLAVIIYTSGSTGIPKGVMLSHANIICGVAGLSERVLDIGSDDTYIAYLPLAHVLELASEISCLSHGVTIGYSSPQTLSDQSTKIKRGCKGDISILKPTLMTSVPLVLDRIYKAVWDKVNEGGPFARKLFTFAYKYKEFWMLRGYDTPVIDKLIFKKIRDLLGGHVRIMVAGSAPLSATTQRFINICFCMPMGQGYGLTETFGSACVVQAYDNNTDHVGNPVVCSEIMLRDWDEGGYLCTDEPKPRGEVLIGGGNVALGYFKNPEKTAEDFMTIKGTRYFCTGDIGEFQPDGTLRIIDRKKDLVKLQAGEYVSLGKVETALKLCPLVEQICVYAESRRTYTICFVVPSPKHLVKMAHSLGMNGVGFTELCDRKDVAEEVLKELQRAARRAKLEKFEIPCKLILTPEPWTSEAGLLTDAFKLKRHNLKKYYHEFISQTYI